MKLRLGWILLRNSFIEWLEDKAPRLGAALAYYTAFSLSPLLVIVIAIAGLVFGQEAAEGQIIAQMQGLVGHDGAQAIAAMVQNARKPSSGIIATVVGLATLLIGATGVFGELRDALNTIWEVQPRPGRGLTGLIKDRFLSFTMVVGVGFLLLVSLSVSAGLAAMGRFLGSMLPGLVILSQIINFVVSLSVIGILFALIYRYLPDLKIPWHDVWIGAALTAGLFEIGKFLIGFYLGNSSISSAYGAASSLAIILVWIYYSAQIFLLGAEFTHVYAKHRESLLALR
jgi:membrane protein